jgi:hypothetical protein
MNGLREFCRNLTLKHSNHCQLSAQLTYILSLVESRINNKNHKSLPKESQQKTENESFLKNLATRIVVHGKIKNHCSQNLKKIIKNKATIDVLCVVEAERVERRKLEVHSLQRLRKANKILSEMEYLNRKEKE